MVRFTKARRCPDADRAPEGEGPFEVSLRPLFGWGVIIYAIGVIATLVAGWYTAGTFDVSLLVLALAWPVILCIFVLGALFRYYSS